MLTLLDLGVLLTHLEREAELHLLTVPSVAWEEVKAAIEHAGGDYLAETITRDAPFILAVSTKPVDIPEESPCPPTVAGLSSCHVMPGPRAVEFWRVYGRKARRSVLVSERWEWIAKGGF